MTAKQLQGVKRTTVRLPMQLAIRLAVAAAANNESQQEIVEAALLAHLNKKYAGERDK